MGTAFLKLHISILIAGFTGILGKLIELPEGPLVWYRMLITSALFFGYLLCTSRLPRVPARDIPGLCGVGALTAVHWIFFYGSIKYANVSIAVVCFALTGFFTAVLEPLLSKKKLSLLELFFSLLTVGGIALIFHFDTRYRTGITLGVLSALFAAFFTMAIRKQGTRHGSSTILLYQMIGGFAFLTLAAPVYLMLLPSMLLTPSFWDIVYLFLLASVCTIGLFLLQIQALQTISTFTVNLSYNLEPIYSIIMAMILFNEAAELSASFFIGLGLICASVLLQSLHAIRQRGSLN